MTENHAHYPALDGVRGLAVLIVIGAHTHPQVFPGGNIGVDLFFVLSGFLISTILLNEQRATGSISIKNFYVRRALRLLPALVLLLISTIVYSWQFDPELLPTVLASAKSVIGYYWNWYLSFDWQPQVGFLRHLWSLSVEEQFYIFWPIVLLLTVSRPRLMGWTPLTASFVQDGGVADHQRRRPWSTLSQSDWIWRSRYFKYMALIAMARSYCARSFDGTSFLLSSPNCPDAWSPWRLAVALIIGGARLVGWGTR